VQDRLPGAEHQAGRQPPGRGRLLLSLALWGLTGGLLAGSVATCSDDEEDGDDDADGEDDGEDDADDGVQGDGGEEAAARRRARTAQLVGGQQSKKTKNKYKPFITAWEARDTPGPAAPSPGR
jgi:hypothetical protein